MVIDPELRRRAHKRPLRDLTDEEIDVLDRFLGRIASDFLRDDLRGPLETISTLAMYEKAQRDFEEDR